MDILKRFKMLYCNEITTPIAFNLKLLCDTSSESVDAMMYHKMIGSLIFFTNTRLDI